MSVRVSSGPHILAPTPFCASATDATRGFSIAARVKRGPDYLMPTPFCASATDATRGSGFSSRSAVRPPHDGLRRMGRYNLTGALAAGQQQDRQTLRTPPTRRPREDILLPEQIRYLLAGSSNRRNCGAVLAPAELATVNPHPVQNHGQAPGDRDDGSTHPASLSYPHAPRFQPRPFAAVGKQYLGRLVEHRAQQGVATFGHPAIIIGLAGLVALRRQADMCADRPRVGEALRLVDRRTVGQRNDRADPWRGHQPPTHWVAANRVEQHLVQDGELLAHDPADVEQRLGDRGQPRKARDELANPRLVSRAADGADF